MFFKKKQYKKATNIILDKLISNNKQKTFFDYFKNYKLVSYSEYLDGNKKITKNIGKIQLKMV